MRILGIFLILSAVLIGPVETSFSTSLDQNSQIAKESAPPPKKSASLSEKSPRQITIGLIPGEDPERLRKNGLELARRLQKKINIQINIYVSKNYQGLIDAMKAKKVDFAFFTAMSFVFAENQAGAKVLLKKVWEHPYYHSTIVARKDSNLNSVDDLKGKRFAFVDEKSASGYLYPLQMFKEKGIDHKKFFSKITFAGNHELAIAGVVKKEFDAGAVFADGPEPSQSAWNRFAPADLAQMKLLWISKPIPNDPFCVRKDFYAEFPRVAHDVMFGLIDLKDDEDGNVLKKLLQVTEMQLATSRQYEPVREIVRALNLKLD